MPLSSYGTTAKEEIFSFKSIFYILLFSFIYFAFSVLILNYNLTYRTITGNFPVNYKTSIVLALLEGSITAFSYLDFVLLVITSLLVGMNILLIIKTIASLENKRGKVSFTVGGSALVGFAVAGCSSCGFSLLSLVGLSASLSFIPFGALGLHIIVIALLIFSVFYSLRSIYEGKFCKIK